MFLTFVDEPDHGFDDCGHLNNAAIWRAVPCTSPKKYICEGKFPKRTFPKIFVETNAGHYDFYT